LVADTVSGFKTSDSEQSSDNKKPQFRGKNLANLEPGNAT